MDLYGYDVGFERMERVDGEWETDYKIASDKMISCANVNGMGTGIDVNVVFNVRFVSRKLSVADKGA